MIDNADIASFADDSPSISVGKKHFELQKILQKASAKICIWFHKNGMKTNQDKCHFLSSFGINKKFWLPAYMLENSVSQKLLAVTTGRKFNFNDYVTNLCDNASKKNQVYARTFHTCTQTQKRLLMIFLDNTKLKLVGMKITTFFKRRVSIKLLAFSS